MGLREVEMGRRVFRLRLRVFALGSTLVLLACNYVFGQMTTARLEGFVKDPSEAIVPGVTVVATNEGTNLPYESITNDQGFFVFPKLPPGNYIVTAELTGFKKYLTKGVHLEVGDAKTLTVKLETGEMSETVTVSSQTTAVDTVTTQVGSVVNQKQLQDLP